MSVIQTAALAASMVEDKLTESGQIGRTEQKEYVCFAESDFQFSSGSCPGISGKPFVDGDTVTVTWDGTSYTRTAKAFPITNLATGFYVGNLFPLGEEDTGEPFALLSTYDDDGNFMGFIAIDVYNFNGDSSHRIGCSVFAETIHPIDQKYLPDNVVDCDELTCTLADGSVLSFSEAIMQLFAESLGTGVAKTLTVTDNNGALRQQLYGKQSVAMKSSAGNVTIYYPATFSISPSGPAQISSFVVFRFDDIGYCEIKYNLQFHNKSQDVILLVQATIIQA